MGVPHSYQVGGNTADFVAGYYYFSPSKVEVTQNVFLPGEVVYGNVSFTKALHAP